MNIECNWILFYPFTFLISYFLLDIILIWSNPLYVSPLVREKRDILSLIDPCFLILCTSQIRLN